MSRGEIQELIDVDGRINFIGIAINHSARLATASTKIDNNNNHPGLLIHETLARHLQSTLRASHWLSYKNPNHLSIEVEGKRDEKFLCYYPPIGIWPTTPTINYQYDDNFRPSSKNAAIISYELPNFSDGDLNQLSQRFRAITDVFNKLALELKLPLDYFYFSPGGDGGVMVFTDLEKKPVFDLAKNFAEKLLIASQNKSSLISVECRVGLHYGTVVLYQNAQEDTRPAGEDIFIADELLADKSIGNLGSFVFTEEFKVAVSGGDDKYFFQIFQSAPALNFLFRNIPRYVYKPIIPKSSCNDYLATLSQTELYRWIKLNLFPKQIEQVWFALFGKLIAPEIKNDHSSHWIIELCKESKERFSLPDLYKELAKQAPEPYKLLPNDNNEVLELIEKANKEKFSSLDLSCQSLNTLPEELFQLTEIEVLYLAGNELTTLPKDLFALSKLDYLDLYNNVITSLPNEFSEPNPLRYLDLSHNNLTTLPNEFGKLINLTFLDLSYNHLTQLPSEFGNLASLKSLSIPYSELTNLPNEFGKLTNIEVLDLSYNKLAILPNEFGGLSKLHLLYLSHNQLVELPSEFGNLINLKSLYLSNNKLNKLPTQFGKLVNLEFLYLSHNQLTQLPIELGRLTKLKKLTLEENQKGELEKNIPPEILKLEDNPQQILNFLSQTFKANLDEVKMLIVGEGKVGKTSLVKRLVDNEFNPLEPMTNGIVIKKQWKVKLTNEREVKVNIWDFGGQEIMHSTHQFFLTKRSLYLLVLDARQNEQQNRLNYWLKTIQHFTDSSPVIIVINQTENNVSLELERKKLKADYPNITGFIETSCKEPRGIDLLSQKILLELSQLPLLDTLLPYSWLLIKDKLENLSQDHLSYEDYHQICAQSGLDKQNEETLIDFLHDLGVTLCFHKDLRMSSTQILNPQWVTKGVYKILTYNGLAINKGILKTSNLSQILNNEEYSTDNYRFLIAMMQKFQLCFDLDDNSQELLIPDLLPKDSPELELETWNKDNSLRFQYDYDDFLPSSIISRFIVKMSPSIYQQTYWRYGVVIESQDKHNRALVKADLDKNKIFISVNGRADSRKILLALICEKFSIIHNTFSTSTLKVKEQIPLPEDPTIVFDYKYLQQLLELEQEFIIAPGIMRKIPIRPLLEGIEKEPELANKLSDEKLKQDLANDEFSTVQEVFSKKSDEKASYNIELKRSLQDPFRSISIFEFETVKVDIKGKIIERKKKQANQYIEHLGNGVMLEMVEIPAGEFMMGTSESDIEKVVAEYKRYGWGGEWIKTEMPQHKVTIPTFYIGKYQITQGQWKRIMGDNPSHFKRNDKLPVENVSWEDSSKFCEKLSDKTGRKYRLPSETEWEYACRAGSKTAFTFGETINTEIVNYYGYRPYGEAAKGENRANTIAVGSLGVANEFGIYDMHGNVWEWCQDEWHDNYNNALMDGSALEIIHSKNIPRILRGGSYNHNAAYCRSAYRSRIMPNTCNFDLGFRVVLVA
ncbi:MAG: SUMF1/EgtB/PvdO family nonheme iron enzyme [Acidobacteria bacterium]|nr:SUMF1/EgtB/PvdO family nonheme iron enzyme [Acidobacteriota bacterium]